MGDVFGVSHISVIHGFEAQNCFRIHCLIRKTGPFINLPHTKRVHY